MEFGFPQAHSRLTPSRGMLYLSLSPSWNCCLDSTNPQFFRGNVDNHAEAPFSESSVICLLGAIHKGRPHPRGEGGVSQKRTHADAGGRGVSGKKRTSANSNFHQNFRILNSVLCAKRQHLTEQAII